MSQYDSGGKLVHFLSIKELKSETLLKLLEKTAAFLNSQQKIIWQPSLVNKTVAALFFENSTRTRISFELAAKHLGATFVNVDLAKSSLNKGETLQDTLNNLYAMDVDAFVIRHHEDGVLATLAQDNLMRAKIINAGDGCHEHPTQALLDVFTLRYYKSELTDQIITIVGDILHSRVAASLISALNHLGAKQVRVVGPAAWVPETLRDRGVHIYHELNSALNDADAIITLRIQKERMEHNLMHDDDYHRDYGLTEERLRLAKPDAIVMHPGPINRGVEIDNAVANGKQSVILMQAKFGVAARMAVMDCLLTSW